MSEIFKCFCICGNQCVVYMFAKYMCVDFVTNIYFGLILFFVYSFRDTTINKSRIKILNTFFIQITHRHTRHARHFTNNTNQRRENVNTEYSNGDTKIQCASCNNKGKTCLGNQCTVFKGCAYSRHSNFRSELKDRPLNK